MREEVLHSWKSKKKNAKKKKAKRRIEWGRGNDGSEETSDAVSTPDAVSTLDAPIRNLENLVQALLHLRCFLRL